MVAHAAMTGLRTAVAFALALLLAAGTAQAQDSVKLVSTTGQATSQTSNFAFDFAQAFTTGGISSAGYTLTRVDLHLKQTGAAPPSYTLSIHQDSSSLPGSSLGTLTNPTSLPTGDNELAEFTTSGITLAPNTTYWVVLDLSAASTETKVFSTYSQDEDPGGAAGWSTANTLHQRNPTETTWGSPNLATLRLAIHGSANPLVSNTGQADDTTGDATLNNDLAQAFTTGSYAYGYTLSGVGLEMQDTAATTPTYSVSIYFDASSRPGTRLASGTLANPTSLPNPFGLAGFTSADGIALAPNTTYWVVLDVTANKHGDTKVKRTTSSSEDPGGATGWSIGDTRLYRAADATDLSWTPETATHLQMAVYGSERAVPPPPNTGTCSTTDTAVSAVTNGGPELAADCSTLLDLMDTLGGTGHNLNWETGTTMANWDAITVAGNPARVTRLRSSSLHVLKGRLPARLTRLTALTELVIAGSGETIKLTGSRP